MEERPKNLRLKKTLQQTRHDGDTTGHRRQLVQDKTYKNMTTTKKGERNEKGSKNQNIIHKCTAVKMALTNHYIIIGAYNIIVNHAWTATK